MNNFLSEIKEMDSFTCAGPVANEEIILAEQKLGISFAVEYRDYITQCGFASCLGHEFTGICKSKRINVVDVTLSERSKNPQMLNSLYVVEQTNMDGIVLWQDSQGKLYKTTPEEQPIIICNSLYEYIHEKEK